MKNETDRSKSSKISVLKKKLSSTETVSDEPEKKPRKGKKSKKPLEENASKPQKSSFARKFTFGKYMSTPSALPRASSSKSMSESETSDRLSSGYSTLTPTSLKRAESEEVPSDTCSMEGASSVLSQSKPPVSVTPYAISSWRPTSQPELHEEGLMTDNNKNQNSELVADEDEEKVSETVTVPENTGQEVKKSENTGSEVTETASEAMPAFGNLVMDLVKDRPDLTSNISQSGLERKEHLYKILVIGELGTGKTSIIKRYVHQFFSQHYRATIGVDFALKVLNWDANTIIRLQLWDIAGQERFGNMTRVYYKDAVGAFIVFDVTRVATFDAVDKWKQDLDSKVQLPDGSSIPCVLLGNKCDQQKEGIVNTPSRMDEYCKEKGFSGWFETSAKENVNIEEAARFLVNKILLNDKLMHSSDANKDNDRIAIDEKGDANGYTLKNSKTCSC